MKKQCGVNMVRRRYLGVGQIDADVEDKFKKNKVGMLRADQKPLAFAASWEGHLLMIRLKRLEMVQSKTSATTPRSLGCGVVSAPRHNFSFHLNQMILG
jgi:hypothetical protein